MERTYTYQFQTRQYGDEYDYNEYEYTVEDSDLKTAIVDELFYTYFKEKEMFDTNQILVIKKALKNFTDDNDNWEELANDFESELKEYFRDNAYEEYKNRR
jgi:hypothetical protein